MSSTVIIETIDLSIGYKSRLVSEQINVALRAGELVCLIGPNGAGKSTLMRTLAGMQSPLHGAVHLLGEDITHIPATEMAKRLSVVLTERIEVGLLTGYALVALGRHPYTDWTGQLSKQDESIVRWAVQAVGAERIATRPIRELSDGERQKLMIARALAQEPHVMLLDEPTAFLDLPRRVEIILLLRSLARESDRTILMSTHDLDLALRNADRIWILSGSGELVTGAPEDLVLSGEFELAFASEGVYFDQQTGSFVATTENESAISLVGEGIRQMWTKRALERIGYRIEAGQTQSVAVLDNGWELANRHGKMRFERLLDLTDHLRRLTAVDT